MSLINQMLKDIDQRQGNSSAPASTSVPLAVTRARASGLPVGWLVGGVLVAVVAGAYWFRQAAQPVPAPAVAAPMPVAVPVAAAPQASAVAVAPTPVAEVAPVASAPAPVVVAAPAPAPAPKKTAPAESQAKVDVRPEPMATGQVTRVLSAEQRADNAYRDASAQLRQGRALDAQKTLQQALADQPTHQDARLLYAQVLRGEGRVAEARSVLTEGMALRPQAFALHAALAQMQLLARDTDQAVTTLERGLSAAGDNAAYNALLATALQQQSRHAEAVQHYVVALRQQPDSSNWLVGLGVSLQAQGNTSGAAEAYQRALDLGLPASLSQFARDRLQQVSH